MRIFLSFASEHEQVAEAILLALRDRGHSVFFSKDDLPPAETYDARIQRGVQASDFMIYLISPESVTRGRYTLTELSFARQRWPNPNRHLLPVLVAPTPLDTIPAYLKAVTILEPLGNIAAETSAEVDKVLTKSQNVAIIWFGLFGIVTALCSYFSVLLFSPEMIQRPKFPYSQIGSAPILPGLFFGLLVAACAYRFAVRERFLLSVILLFTAGGWIAAVNSSVTVDFYLAQFQKPIHTPEPDTPAPDTPAPDTPQGEGEIPKPPGPTSESLPLLGLAGIVGGFVGGFFTLFGLALASPTFRTSDRWSLPLAIATILGVVLSLDLRDAYQLMWLVLFVVWQPAVSASIAREFARKRS